MADFRDVSPKSLTWRRGGKGSIYANRIVGEKTIKFQIPKMNCNIAVHSPGMFRMELKMSPSIPIHAQFMDWIADLEQSAQGPWGNVSKSSAIYNNGIRVMFFSDTNCFDSSGNMSADFMKAKSVSAIFSLTGLWLTDTKYGLKFKVEQFKYFEEAIPYPADVEEETTIVSSKACMFVDDD
jgi:hypothetical protein